MPEAAQSKRTKQYAIEDFRGDFQEISLLMKRSWAENAKQPFLYTADFLASCFEYPGASFSLAPAIYDGSAPLAFTAAFPRRVRLARRELNLVIISFLTVASQHKRRGFGIVLWNELVKRARAAGFDGMVNYCMDGEAMDGMILGCCQMLKLPTCRAYTIPYWSRVLFSRKVFSAESTPRVDLIERFLGLTATIPERTPLARLWSHEEAEWQCLSRTGSIVFEVESGPRRGMLAGCIMQVANAAETKCVIIEDVLWGNLEPQERTNLLDRFLDHAILKGAQVAVAPVMGYADLELLRVARFRPSNRKLHAYLTVWNGEPFTGALASMYLDVF